MYYLVPVNALACCRNNHFLTLANGPTGKPVTLRTLKVEFFYGIQF